MVGSLEDANSLELLQGVSDDLASSDSMVFVSRAVVLLASEEMSESADTDVRSEIDLSGQSSNSNVVPVGIERGQFLKVTGLQEFDVLDEERIP